MDSCLAGAFLVLVADERATPGNDVLPHWFWDAPLQLRHSSAWLASRQPRCSRQELRGRWRETAGALSPAEPGLLPLSARGCQAANTQSARIACPARIARRPKLRCNRAMYPQEESAGRRHATGGSLLVCVIHRMPETIGCWRRSQIGIMLLTRASG